MIILFGIIEFFKEDWWSGVAALATIIYTLITYWLFRKTKQSIDSNNKISAFNAYIKIKESLCLEDVDKMVESCGSNKMVIVSLKRLASVGLGNSFYKADVKRKLIDVIEDLSKYERDGLISFEDVDFAYGYLILNVGNCDAIVKYINEMRKSYDNIDLYKGFELLFIKLRKNLKLQEQSKYRTDFKAKVKE